MTNQVNGYRYVGQTGWTVEARWARHKVLARYNPSALGLAIREYGERSFTVELLCLCETRKEAEQKERHFVELFQSRTYQQGYNLREGGGSRGKHAPQSIELASENAHWKGKRFTHSDEVKAKIGAVHRGKVVSEETRDKLRIARANQAPMSAEALARTVASHLGKKHSEETRRKMRLAWEKRRGALRPL